MEQPTIATKLHAFAETGLYNKIAEFIDTVSSGDLAGFEDQLRAFFEGLYNLVAGEALVASAGASQPLVRQKARFLRLGKLEERPMQVQIRTGHYVTVTGLYAKHVPKGYEGARHLLRGHWKLIKGASPAYYGAVCMFSVLCPSFEVACHILQTQGIKHNRDGVRELSHALARHCKSRQAELTRGEGETLRGKRVLIGVDGGRTRMRHYTGEKNKERMLYTEFRNKKLVCGSGIIESGIRRVINLRFKNASAFWKPENVEGLYFLRGILLAFRWNILINNLLQG